MRVLIVRVGAMGDVLHALPAVAALRRARPGWEIGWVVDPRWAPLLADGDAAAGPHVTRLHLADTKLWKAGPLRWKTLRSIARLRRELRVARYDLAVDLQGTLRSAVIARMSGAREISGYADPRERAAARLYRTPVPREGAHVVLQGLHLLAAATGVPLEAGPVQLPRAGWAEAWAEGEAVLARPLLVLGAGAGWGAKQWPAERFGELAGRMRGRGFDVAVNAPRADDVAAAAVVASSGGAARLVVCNVAGLVALLRRTDLFVGGDSGPTHLAAALGVPVVALFGPTDPARNGPWGPAAVSVVRHGSSAPSYKRVAEIDHGLARVSVEEVLAAVTEVCGW